MEYSVRELAPDKFMRVAENGEPVLATMNNRELAQRMAIKLTVESRARGDGNKKPVDAPLTRSIPQ